jgi:membrane-associated protein
LATKVTCVHYDPGAPPGAPSSFPEVFSMHAFALIGEQIEPFLRSYGSIVLMLMVFAECGLTTGFFLPGDSALFVAGFLSSQGVLVNVWPLSFGCFVAAVIGNQVAYVTGQKLGPTLFRKPDALIFRPSRLREAEYFFARRGTAAIILARWLPLARTFGPIVAGATRMDGREFLRANLIGAGLWAIGLTHAGYWLGNAWPELGDRLELITAIIVVVSITPMIVHAVARRRRSLDLADSFGGSSGTGPH